jgi:hypothetical protein
VRSRALLSAPLTLLWLGAASAGAATVVSGSLAPPPNGGLRCTVVNTSAVERVVTIELLDELGAVAASNVDVALPPGVLGQVVSIAARRCRFSFKGSKQPLRFTVETFDSAGTPLSAIEAR